MVREARNTDVSAARKRLIDLVRDLGYGTIEGISLRAGEPVLDPVPRIVRDLKLSERRRVDEVSRPTDYALKGQVRDLFSLFDSHRDATILSLEVKDGLPYRVRLLEETAGIKG